MSATAKTQHLISVSNTYTEMKDLKFVRPQMNDWIIGVDVGGTFTDFSARNTQSGETHIHKRPSTPDDPSRAILHGLQELLAKSGIASEGIDRFAHGTTVATNALLQRRGAKVGMITTEGFRDLVEIGRQSRPLIYDLQVDAPMPLAGRENRLEVAERIGPDGKAITEPTDEEIAKVVDGVGQLDGVESIAVCLLFSFLNASHETKLKAALQARYPEIYVSASSEVQPEFREYERFSTALINAFLQPEVARYMHRLRDAIGELAPNAKLGIFQSSGGLMSIEKAAAFPVRTALSGPAAGAVGAAAAGALSEIGDIITLDMGGTSTDVCLIKNGETEIASARDIAGFRIRLPMVDIHTVGAGGGSIAHIGPDGLMKVGPQSAGAVPGPACYCKGGTLPTVSDANAALGRLPKQLAGGELVIDVEKAQVAMAYIAADLGISATKAALGVAGIVTSNMTRAIRAVSTEQGHDPRQFTLMPFGGAGGLHAVEVAAALGMKRILVPHAPGILCADGLIQSDLEENFVATCRTPLEADKGKILTALADLEAQANAWINDEASDATDAVKSVQLDMRYIGQNYELSIPIYRGSGAAVLPDDASLSERFFAEHERAYGHVDRAAPIELVNLRIRASASLSQTRIKTQSPEGTPTPVATQEAWFQEDAPHQTGIYERADLPVGTRLEGPVIITQLDATTVVPPGATISVDTALNLIVEIENV